jgi:hypothetical protein
MKKLLNIFILTMFLLSTGVTFSKNIEIEKVVDDYKVQVSIDKNPPVVGENNIDVRIRNNSGDIINDAQVMVFYSMPAMPGMPAMNYNIEAKKDGSSYRAVLNLSMAGPWNIQIKFKRASEAIKNIKFSIDVK